MKNLILFLVSFLLIYSLSAQDEKPEKSEEVKVKIEDPATSFPETEVKEKALPEVEIELVEKLNVSVKSTEAPIAVHEATLSQPVAVADLAPANPDKNLVIYFILLMVIVVGIMLIATLIPAPRSRDNQ